jgi:hypothetical protein
VINQARPVVASSPTSVWLDAQPLEVSNQTDLHPFLFRSLVMTSNNGLALVCKFDEETKETDFR